MGCGISVLNQAASQDNTVSGKTLSAADIAEMKALQAPPPKVSLHVGVGVKKATDGAQNIVLIFGGPGSMKGVMIEQLVTEYNFVLITTEDIVLNYLPNKVANTVETTQEIQELLRTDPALLTLEWVIHLISAKLATSITHRFLIDIVPNLYSIQRVDSFAKSDCLKEMASFERRLERSILLLYFQPQIEVHSVLFAINFAVAIEQLGLTTPGIAIKGAAPGTQEKDDKEQKKNIFQETSDEMDNNRMRRRLGYYTEVARPFIDYFQESNRVVSVDVGIHRKEHLWKRVADFFRDYGFDPVSESVFVVLFVFDEAHIEGLDPIYYKMLKVRLSSIISDRNSSMEEMVSGVRQYIGRSSAGQSHLVVLDCLNLKLENAYKKLNFLEVRECYLEHFIKYKSTTVAGVPFKKPFKAITTTNGQVCLFPEEVDTKLCKQIAFCFGDGAELKKATKHQTSRKKSSHSNASTPDSGCKNGFTKPATLRNPQGDSLTTVSTT